MSAYVVPGMLVRIVSTEAVDGLSEYAPNVFTMDNVWRCVAITQRRPKAVALVPVASPESPPVIARPWCLKRLKKAELRALERAT